MEKNIIKFSVGLDYCEQILDLNLNLFQLKLQAFVIYS